MPTVIADVGAANANSYVTVAEADAYFGDSLGRPLWSTTSQAVKEAAVISASRTLDQYMEWLGYRVDTVQSMDWPRSGVVNPNLGYSQGSYETMDVGGFYNWYRNDEIPQKLKYATYELAYYMAQNDGLNFANQTVDSVKVGPISVDFTAKSTDSGIPSFVENMIGHLGSPVIRDGIQVGMARLVRV